VFTRVAKPVIGDEKRFFHRLIAANFSADINHRQVLKLAPFTQFSLQNRAGENKSF